MAFFRQLGLLLWKNVLLQRRKICVTVFQIILPLLFAVFILVLRFKIPKVPVPADLRSDKNRDVSRSNAYALDYSPVTLYTPNCTLIREIMSDVEYRVNSGSRSNVAFVGFSSSKEMLDYYNVKSKKVNMAVVFENVKLGDTVLPKNLRITLRPPDALNSEWRTTETSHFVQDGTLGYAFYQVRPDYQESGFLFLQRSIDEAVITHWNPGSNSTLNNLSIRLQEMPKPPFVKDPMIRILRIALPLLLMLSFMLMAIQTTKAVVYEKERKLKESMKLMGLSAAAHWTSWFVYSLIYVVIIMAVYTILCGVVVTDNGAALANSDPFLFFVFLLFYGVAIISFCFMISVLFQRTNTAAAICGIVFFTSYCPYVYIETTYQTMSRSAKLACCLVMNLGMAFGAYNIAVNEGTGTGAQWTNIHEPASLYDNFSLWDAMRMLLLDTLIHLLVTWYIDNVRPGELGVPKPWYFPFSRAYWCGTKQMMGDYSAQNNYSNKYFENEPAELKAGISIQNLRKVFGRGDKKSVAVDGINLTMYQDHITVLLGHNGAGKTTTMSMLTGFIPSTDGSAVVNGYNINTDIESVRKHLGLCPQHNILFDTLSVREHLHFFASLKGCPRKDIDQEVTNTIKEVGLASPRNQTNTQAQHLSGGQKRKLSVAIALIAGSKIVILDEPTSGMDPAARRQTWDILQRNRTGRTMLLTTHYMDEADTLGDRIAIMADGQVKCCGTSYFLKKLYGTGYHLVVVTEPTCQVKLVTALVTQHIPPATLERQNNTELSYILPYDQTNNFSRLFEELERQQMNLGVSSFGITATTMEEVFLKVDRDDGVTEDNGVENEPVSGSYVNLNEVDPHNVSDFNQGFKKSTGYLLELSRFRGIFIKKMLHSWRNKTIAIIQFLLPFEFTAIALAISKVGPGKVEQIPLKLDLSPFKDTYVPVRNSSSPFAASYRAQFSGTSNKPEDVTTNNVSEYFLSRVDTLGRGVYNRKMVIGAEFESDSSIKGYYNGMPFHSEPISLSYIMNSLLKHFMSDEHSVTTINHPLPFNATDSSSRRYKLAMVLGLPIAFCFLFGMAFLTSSFVYFLVKERMVGSKHLQVVSGVGPFIFWMANLLWDYINYLLSAFLILVVFAAFKTEAYVDEGRLGLVFLLLLVYGLTILPFMYLVQYLFKSPATGVVVTIILNMVTGLFALLTVDLLNDARLYDDAATCNWTFSILFTHFNFGQAIMNIFSNYINRDYCISRYYTAICVSGIVHPCCKDTCTDHCIPFVENFLEWESPGVGRHIVLMLIQCAVFLLLTFVIEYQLLQRIWYLIVPKEDITASSQSQDEDDDVVTERRRVEGIQYSHANSDVLILNQLYKRYGNFVAVDHLSIGIPKKECFGLLGQSGAGKTTTLKMLTGDIMFTHGNAHLFSFDIRNNIKKVQANMGYCPQFDALIDQMTGRETLAMYARLKGIPENKINNVCKDLLDRMMLRKYADKPTSDYSGGSKRKLSTAIALIGDPAFIMLDEPSTGVDPVARRQLWDVLSKVRESGRTLLLTSHSMEECDALCTRLAIMVNGRFVCLGTPQHLKNKFGQGYTLIARMATVQIPRGHHEETAPASSEHLVRFIKSHFPNSRVFDCHEGYLDMQIPFEDVRLSQIFCLMEQAKAEYNVEDYTVHQTSLEQIFLGFARKQVPPKEDRISFCKRICCC